MPFSSTTGGSLQWSAESGRAPVRDPSVARHSAAQYMTDTAGAPRSATPVGRCCGTLSHVFAASTPAASLRAGQACSVAAWVWRARAFLVVHALYVLCMHPHAAHAPTHFNRKVPPTESFSATTPAQRCPRRPTRPSSRGSCPRRLVAVSCPCLRPVVGFRMEGVFGWVPA